MQKNILLYNLNGYGGAENLFLRICKYYANKDTYIEAWTNGINNISLVDEVSRLTKGLKVFNCKKELQKLIRTIPHEDKVKLICFTFDLYMDIEILVKNNNNIELFMYVIHPHGVVKAASINNKYIQSFIICEYRKFLVEKIINGNIIFMDGDCVNHTLNYYGIKNDLRCRIIRLPMIINTECLQSNYEEINYDIIAPARAEFPFKAYLLWLVDNYQEIIAKCGSPRMLIVSGGRDFEMLNSHYIALPNYVRCMIVLKSWVNYDELVRLMSLSKVIVGMGTTVLDAASVSRPAIIADAYKEDGSCSGLFCRENAECSSMNGAEKISDYLQRIFAANPEQYNMICVDSYETLNKEYNIEGFLDKFTIVKNKSRYWNRLPRLVYFIDRCIKIVVTAKQRVGG